MINKYKKGKHSYTRWDKSTKQVTSTGKRKPKDTRNVKDLPVKEIFVSSEPALYSNEFIVHSSRDEFIIDSVFLNKETKKAKVVSRLIISPKNAKKLYSLLRGKNIRG